MAIPAEFARETRAIRRVEQAPAAWEAEFADEPGVAVFAAELRDTDGRAQLLTLDTDTTERQRRAFAAARSLWRRYGRERSVVPVVATGDEPRPWVALDPPETGVGLGKEPLPEATVRALLVDLAEGCWVIRRSPWSGVPAPRQHRIEADGSGAAVHWPLTVPERRESPAVRTLGEIGYEAITGEQPAAERKALPASVRDCGRYSERLCAVVESALRAPSGRHANCYELKRALLFGPATEPVGDTHRKDESGRAEGRSLAVGRFESGITTADHGGQAPGDGTTNSRSTEQGRNESGVRRRAVVGALGLSAIPLAGVFAVGSPGDGAESPTPYPPEASFVFADEGTAIRVTHAGGDPIAADRLIVRNTRYSGIDDYEWTAFSTVDTVEPGDTISIDIGGRVRMFAHVVWQSPDGEEVVLDRRRTGPNTREGSDP